MPDGIRKAGRNLCLGTYLLQRTFLSTSKLPRQFLPHGSGRLRIAHGRRLGATSFWNYRACIYCNIKGLLSKFSNTKLFGDGITLIDQLNRMSSRTSKVLAGDSMTCANERTFAKWALSRWNMLEGTLANILSVPPRPLGTAGVPQGKRRPISTYKNARLVLI